ncbi:sigma-70 family RNA polymerase sigma factor [candidate division WWE3 bacterium]|uniref:Sigma-70 family RNA polymerase sigma factor n=1 Tax=candidate division WWE3 bacterium TaxID=2053526 RepID=A0A955LJJ7_UNCKA|nr:sigma-70 family RNA polymerase sigma factor [candidate division WWE3 bacterium]
MTDPHPDERALVRQAKADAEAFGVLYDRYLEKIYTYIFYRVRNQQDAEDLTAKVFHKALDHIQSYEDRGYPFSAWLYRIAHNMVANYHRDSKRKNERTLPLTDWVTTFLPSRKKGPHQSLVDDLERQALLDAIQRLPPDRQQLILLKFIDELTNAEIGDIMGRTEGAIKSLLHRTLIALGEDLELQGYGKPKKRSKK